jgi:hypothetical protein
MPAPSLQLDSLAQSARDILKLDALSSYSRLCVGNSGYTPAFEKLENLSGQSLFCRPVSSPDEAEAVRAALWLWHDWLESAHRIVQSLNTPSGAFWHAIMHRREGDLSNSKYWYARCADHPILPALGVAAGGVISPYPADKELLKIAHDGFHPAALVDLVQKVHDKPEDPRHSLAVALQQLEWRVLFDHCVRAAIAGGK